MALNGEVPLARLVDLAAERLHLNVEYDAKSLQGSVTLRVGDPLTNDELWSLTNHMLASRGFTTIRNRDGLFSVVKTGEAPWLGTMDDLSEPGILPGFVTVAVRIRHIPVDKAVEALKFILASGTSHVVPMPPSNVLLLIDLRPRVERAIELLELIDQPLEEVRFEIVKTGRLGASTLAQAATEILQARDAVTGRQAKGRVVALPDGAGVALVASEEQMPLIRSVISRLEGSEPVVTATYTPEHFALAEVAALIGEVLGLPLDTTRIEHRGGFRVVTDELTGTLIVTGTPGQHQEIERLMERLDRIPPAARRQMRTYPIRNRDVAEVVTLLQGLIAARVLDADRLTTEGPSPMGTAQQSLRDVGPRSPSESGSTKTSFSAGGGASTGASDSFLDPTGAPIGGVSLAADEGTNTLLAVGEPRVLDQLEGLIAKLDVRQPQVLLEVRAVSLNESLSRDLGVELQKLDQNGQTQVSLSSVFGLFSDAPTGLGDVGGTGFTGLVLSPGDFAVLVRALRAVNAGRSQTAPRVLVNNNEDATFDSVLQQPFVSTNASETVATTSFGGTQDAGTSLTVRPTIAEGDHLVLEYSVSLSEFLGESVSPALPPPRQQNSLTSTVTIPDGHTVVLGGFEVETDADAASGVPWLSEIPLIGWLFESRSTSRTKTRFFVFLRATVLRHETFADLKYRSRRQRAQASVPDGFPALEPRIIR